MKSKIDYSAGALKIFAQYIRPHMGMFVLDMVLSAVIALIDLVFPYVTRYSMQTLLPENLYTVFFAVMGVIVAAYLLKALFNYLVTVVGHGMGTRVEADMRTDAFTHMQSLSFSYFDKNRTGVLMGRITNDLFEVVELAHHGPENILTCSLTIAGSIIILFFINWKLSLVLLVMTPICLFYCMKQRKNMQNANVEVKKKTGEINASIESGISGIRTAKAFANEKEESEKFAQANHNFLTAKTAWYKYMGLFNAGVECTVGLMQVFVVAIGGWMIMRDEMTLVDLLTFTLYVSSFTSPVRKLTQFMEIWAQGTAGYGRFLQLMRTQPEIQDAEDACEIETVDGNISYRDVSFDYAGTEDDGGTLHHVSMDIGAGETVALVGPSGGGKTTMCSLLPRFYDVTAGAIELDGINIKSIRQADLRRNIGIIQQDVFMFAGTVMENIRYGCPSATDEQVLQAAKRAEIHQEIMGMRDGYQTYIGERGVMLSGGQKQRISIARVFLKNPPVLILDEATSALDSVTEQKIQHSLDMLADGRTCIIIAHRLSTIRNADRIAVIENGKIVEQGTRNELLEINGAYAALERAQGII